MNDLRYYFSSIFLCVALFQMPLAAQVAVATTTPQPAVEITTENITARISAFAEQNLIHPGDLIDVDVVGSTEYDWRGTLSPEGFLSGIKFTENPIFALCRSEESVAEQIAKSYSPILRAPQVSVRIIDRSGRPLSVIYGAVKKNQRFQIKRPILLNEMIVVAGGFTDKASGEIQIFRPPSLNCLSEISKSSEHSAEAGEKSEPKISPDKTDETQYINIKISDLLAGKTNPQIFSGDVVNVLEAKPIYVVGAVGVPKQISVRSEITLTRAVDSAGGILKNADATKVVIFRRGTGETKTIEADLNKIKAGQAEDIVLQAFDVVDVAQTGREKRKFPPVLKMDELNGKSAQILPLRIID